MNWSDRVGTIVSKSMQRIGLLRRIRHLLVLPHQACVILYNALILLILDYGDIVRGQHNNYEH